MPLWVVMSLGYYICVDNKIMEQVTLWASTTKARALQLSWSAPICYNLDYQLMWGGNEVAAGGEILISSFIKQIWPDKLSDVVNCSVIDRVMLFSSSIVFRPSFCFLIDCFNVQITFYCITMGNYRHNFISQICRGKSPSRALQFLHGITFPLIDHDIDDDDNDDDDDDDCFFFCRKYTQIWGSY